MSAAFDSRQLEQDGGGKPLAASPQPIAASRSALAPAPAQRPRGGTIAISAAFLVTSAFIGLALLVEPSPNPAANHLELRQSLMPPEFACSSGSCPQGGGEAAGERLHGR